MGFSKKCVKTQGSGTVQGKNWDGVALFPGRPELRYEDPALPKKVHFLL